MLEGIMRKTVLAVLIAMSAFAGSAGAETYPSHPITLVVPFAAGGPTDAMARILADHMRATLGQNIVIENVTGAAGSLGVGRVVRSAPDGYRSRSAISAPTSPMARSTSSATTSSPISSRWSCCRAIP